MHPLPRICLNKVLKEANNTTSMADTDRLVHKSNLRLARSRMIHSINQHPQRRPNMKPTPTNKIHRNRSHSRHNHSLVHFHQLLASTHPTIRPISSEMHIRIIMANNIINSKVLKLNRMELLHLNKDLIADTMPLWLTAPAHFPRAQPNRLRPDMQQQAKPRQVGTQHPTLLAKISSLV
jgi:hypothetical protein